MKRLIILSSLLLLLFTLSSCMSSSNYKSLQDEYSELEVQYYSLQSKYNELEELYSKSLEKVWSFEDDNIIVSGYFEGESDCTFNEAYDAYHRISKLWAY